MSQERHILVTGGCGFIGAHLVALLLARGHAVRVFDDCSAAGPERLPAQAALVRGDVRDAAALAAATAGTDAVIHLAAAGNVTDSVADPATNFEVNARGTLHALQAATAAGAQRFVFASTGGALIGDAPPPVDERSLPRPISPYGASKLAGEGYCHAFRGAYGLPAIALRFANVYGPGSEHKRGAVTRFIAAALAGEPLVVYGDGTATRDFIHVRDLCAGIVAALERPVADPVLHLASERETPIAELAALVLAATGSGARVEHLPRRRGEVERNVAVAARAREVLGWRAVTSLEDGLSETVAWFRARAGYSPAA